MPPTVNSAVSSASPTVAGSVASSRPVSSACRVHRAQAVVVQGEADAGSGGQLADAVPHVADDLDPVGVQRRAHPGGADRADDELVGADAGDEVDERLRPLDDRVGVGRVGRGAEGVPLLLLRERLRVPEHAGDALHLRPAQEVEEALVAAVVEQDDLGPADVVPATGARRQLDGVEPAGGDGLERPLLVLVPDEDVQPDVPLVQRVRPAQGVLHRALPSSARASASASASTLSMYHLATAVASA